MARPVIESLFPEFCNQGGDNGNMMYLRASLPEAEVIETGFTDEPAFATRDVDFIYLGYMTEEEQELVAAKLMPLRDRLIEFVDAGCTMLFTGNAAELLGEGITVADGHVVPGLRLFDFTCTQIRLRPHRGGVPRALRGGAGCIRAGACPRRAPRLRALSRSWATRFSSPARGPGGGTAAFAGAQPFCTAEVGFGLNRESRLEGFRYKNLFATWLCGPLLPLTRCLPNTSWHVWGVAPRPPSAARPWRRTPSGSRSSGRRASRCPSSRVSRICPAGHASAARFCGRWKPKRRETSGL